MKVVIERNVLLRGLNHVQSVVERRNTIPILSNVLIDADGGGLTLTSTDLDIEVIETVPGNVESQGGTTAQAHLLYDIVRKLPDGAQLEIETDGGEERLSLKAGRSDFSLQTLPRDDFPALSEGDSSHKFTIAAPDLKRLIERTRFAISTEETRYYLNGIYLHQASGTDDGQGQSTLRAVATDGHRLAQAELALPDGADGMPGVIIPRKCVAELSRLIDEAEGDVDIALSSSKIRFSFAGLRLTSKLIDGTFPDYERVIPYQNDKALTVDKKLFAEAVDRVATISSDRGRAVKLAIDGETLTLSVNSPDAGSAVEEIAVGYGADALEIGFNPRYLLDITAQLESDEAKFMLSDAGAPTLIRDPSDANALFVLMPMRV
ncbi:MAG: DNA polymerase III subunit beta [Rhizobiales bacterium]|nr:DNA polymerase III subunit beta [Hyphomicrobiales bacterium]